MARATALDGFELTPELKTGLIEAHRSIQETTAVVEAQQESDACFETEVGSSIGDYLNQLRSQQAELAHIAISAVEARI